MGGSFAGFKPIDSSPYYEYVETGFSGGYFQDTFCEVDGDVIIDD